MAFEEVCFYSHKAWCCGHALLADLTPLKAVADDLASARQIGSPLFDSVLRAINLNPAVGSRSVTDIAL